MTPKSVSPNLKIVPALTAGKSPEGHIVLPRKFVDGLSEFRKFWAGSLSVYMTQGPDSTGNLDDCSLLPSELPCPIFLLSEPEIAAAITSDPRSVVLLSLDDYKQSSLAAVCRERGIPCAYVCEYSLRTRRQIVDATTPNPMRRIRRKVWESQQERRRKNAVQSAAGLQCNGTPTFEAYRQLCPNGLLYFDTRTTADMLATDEEVHRKVSVPQKLRLLFSGRLTRMKGVMDLIAVAKALRKSSVDFHLSICGNGDLHSELTQAVHQENLSEHVSLPGVLDFTTQLVPFAKESIDLFLCCHPQGDPSCTYLETMSCGVPIAGYANEALEGVVRSSGAGWLSPLNRPEALASEIGRLQQQPNELLSMSLKALAFARDHTFEKTFAKRVDHLQALAY